MTEKTIILEDRGRTAWITLNRPDALNSISPQLIDDLNEALDSLAGRRDFCALAITGAGRAFCAGADLKAARARVDGADPDEINTAFLDDLRRVLLRIEEFPAPVIAAVNGLALAGGLEMVLACDLVVAARSAKLGDAHANYGLVPGGGSSVRLPRKIGPTRAKQLIFTGDFLPAETLMDWGLVNEVVADDELGDAVQALAVRLRDGPTRAYGNARRLIRESLNTQLATQLENEGNSIVAMGATADFREGVTAFVEKRKPRFTGN